MSTNYERMRSSQQVGFSRHLNSGEEKKVPNSRQLPEWAWKALVQILGIKLKGRRRVPCLSVFLHAVTLFLATVFSVTGMVHTVYDIRSSYSQTTLTIGLSNIMLGFGWICLGLYSQKLAGRLFSNRNFSESVRIHSRTFFKVSAIGLVTFLSVAMIVLNCYSDFHIFGPNNCDKIFLHNSICHIMFASHVAFSTMSLIWNLLVCCVLLSVCRTHTMGLRKFMLLLEEDARHYMRKFQKQEPVHMCHLSHVASEEGADFFIWDDNISAKGNRAQTLEGNDNPEDIVSSQSTSTVEISASINDEDKEVFEESEDIPSKFSLTRLGASLKSVLSPDQILHYYWRLSSRMRLTSTCLQRWMASWIAYVILWCGDYIIYWISHHATVLEISQFLIPMALLFITTSAFAEANFEGERMIQCIYPTKDRLKTQAFLAQQPLQMKVFNISVSYNAILGVILAFAAAIASRIILDELSIIIQRGGGEQLIKKIKDASEMNCRFYPLAYTLAVCARSTNQAVSKKAYEALPIVCKIPGHLFLFISYCQKSLDLKSWPRKHRKAIARWYTENPCYLEDPLLLAKHVTKYKKRHGITHKRVIKSCHPNPGRCPTDIRYILCYVTKGIAKATQLKQREGGRISQRVVEFIEDVETIKKKNVPEEDLINIIRKQQLTWEQIPNEFLRFKKVWNALLHLMPMTALLRNLGKLTKFGLLQPGSVEEKRVCSRIENQDILKQAYLHPIQILSSLNGYRRGRELRSNQRRWAVNPNIVKSLTKAFMIQLASNRIQMQPKNILIAINVQIAMENHVVGIPSMNCKQTAIALAMTLRNVYSSSAHTITFGGKNTRGQGFDFPLTEEGLFDTEKVLESIVPRKDYEATDFGEPFQYALGNLERVDAIIIMTDHLTTEDQKDIRNHYAQFKQSKRNTSLITICFKNSGKVPPVADPEDPRMLDVIGVDADAVKIILSFLSGEEERFQDMLAGIVDLRVEEEMEQD
ncbi:uncharacterized protein LOC134244189 [Saccostrea cucullata]|uniref:uncharacterized protein LOC134244189 n=1 Tax=Saccostrea cuccullata TaxID=36930 RepID=UPI002ED609AF